MQHVALEDRAVRPVLVAVQGICVQDEEGVLLQRVHFSVHEEVAAVGQHQHEFNAVVIVQAVHAPLIVLFILNNIVSGFHCLPPRAMSSDFPHK